MAAKPQALDRRIIYALVLLIVAWPIATGYILPPVRMINADNVFELIESRTDLPNGIAFVAFDWGPGTNAENQPQTELILEHLFRHRIPVALISQYQLSVPFLEAVPRAVAARLMAEQPNEQWTYGTDWVNLGYRPGGSLVLQSIVKSENLTQYFNVDANGVSLRDLPIARHLKAFKDIKMLAQLTGLVGTFNNYVQFFQTAEYRPLFIHGCTSITIPEAYLYLDSKQLDGLLEGNAGAAWYATRMQAQYPQREKDLFLVENTALGVAHLVLLALIFLGNLVMVLPYFMRGKKAQ